MAVVSSFLAAWRGTRASAPPELDASLQRALHAGRRAWPTVHVDDAVYATYVGERARADVEPSRAVDAIDHSGLYLACGCARGQADALRAFEDHYVPKVAAYLSRLAPDRTFIDEAQQLLRERLLVGESDEPARIAQYTGQGSFEGWVRISAVRIATRLREREGGRARVVPDVSALLEAGDDEERRFLQARYGAEFVDALRAAAQALEPRERSLLRFHFLEKLSPAQIAPLYGVHRTTVLRWLQTAEERLFSATRDLLITRLALSPSECDSMIGLVRSGVDFRLDSLLRGTLS